MKEHFLNLYQYDDWANERILNSFDELNEIPGKTLELFSHILSAKITWLRRIKKEQPLAGVWETWNLNECKKRHREISEEWKEFFEVLSEQTLEEKVTYINLQGNEFTNKVKYILTHVVNHATYHRGQIVLILKGKLDQLPVTDYIVFAREYFSL